jgi:hypothetical protein
VENRILSNHWDTALSTAQASLENPGYSAIAEAAYKAAETQEQQDLWDSLEFSDDDQEALAFLINAAQATLCHGMFDNASQKRKLIEHMEHFQKWMAKHAIS